MVLPLSVPPPEASGSLDASAAEPLRPAFAASAPLALGASTPAAESLPPSAVSALSAVESAALPALAPQPAAAASATSKAPMFRNPSCMRESGVCPHATETQGVPGGWQPPPSKRVRDTQPT
jgi:hypothetical protein